jgi:hypothetical protein
MEGDMVTKKTYLVMLYIAFGLTATGCAQSQLVIETEPPWTETAEPENTPVGDEGITVTGPEATETPQPDPGFAAYWSEAIDDRTGIRFAVPCFWEVQIPTLDPSGLGAFFVRNYDEAFVLSQPRGIVLGSGGVKIDFIYIQASLTGLPSGASLSDVAGTLGDASTEMLSTEEVMINGQEALRFTSQGTFDESPRQSYLFRVDGDLYLLFGVNPGEEVQSTDVQGILNSIAITIEASVQIPDVLPSPAPEGISAPCLKEMGTQPDTESISGILPCVDPAAGSAGELACQMQGALLARDIEALRSLMRDPFAIGYWQSEGVDRSLAAASAELDAHHLPADTSGLTFTTDRSQFPPLFGMPPENMFGPDVDVALVIYSEGWAEDSLGAALLYIAETGAGSYTWHGMVIGPIGLDR